MKIVILIVINVTFMQTDVASCPCHSDQVFASNKIMNDTYYMKVCAAVRPLLRSVQCKPYRQAFNMHLTIYLVINSSSNKSNNSNNRNKRISHN